MFNKKIEWFLNKSLVLKCLIIISSIVNAQTGSGIAFVSNGGVAINSNGDLIVIDAGLQSILKVDTITGGRIIISSSTIGTGPLFSDNFDNQGIVIESDDNLIINDAETNSIFRIDPITGDRKILSTDTIGNGPPFDYPIGLALDGNGNIFVNSAGGKFITRVDSETGDREIISSEEIGMGPNFVNNIGLLKLQNDELIVGDFATQGLIKTNLITGDRIVFSNAFSGTDLASSFPTWLSIEPDGNIVFVGTGSDNIVRVNGDTGERSLLSGYERGVGPFFNIPLGIVIDSSGGIFVTDVGLKTILKVDPVTGDRTILSGDLAVNTEDLSGFTKRIYPNPSNGIFHLGGGGVDDITVITLDGKEVTPLSISQEEIDLSNLKNGLYFVKLIIDGKQTIQRVVKN